MDAGALWLGWAAVGEPDHRLLVCWIDQEVLFSGGFLQERVRKVPSNGETSTFFSRTFDEPEDKFNLRVYAPAD